MTTGDAAAEPPSENSPCWCCGDPAESGHLVHLGAHPEVGVCPRCAHSLSKWAWELEDRSRTGVSVAARDLLRRVRKAVVAHGWHHSRLIGRPLRALGRHLP